MRGQLVCLLLVSLSFAACVGSEGTESGASPSGSNQPLGPGDINPDSEFGAVQGTVLDEETTPIANALVGLADTQFQTVTDAAGVFTFRDVLPGTYVLQASALGFNAVAKQIEVTRAQLSSTSVILQALGNTADVYYEILPQTGYIECAFSTPAWISACTYPYTMAIGGVKNGSCYFGPCVPATGVDLWAMGAPKDLQNNVNHLNFTIRPNVGQVQAEMAWTPSSAAATVMNLMLVCGDYDWIADDCTIGLRYGYANGVKGPSPIKHVIEREDWEDENGDGHKGFYTDDANGTKWDLNTNPEIWVMNYIGLPFGETLDPTTNQVAFGQRFDLWDTVFYNGRGPDDWTVLQDQ